MYNNNNNNWYSRGRMIHAPLEERVEYRLNHAWDFVPFKVWFTTENVRNIELISNNI